MKLNVLFSPANVDELYFTKKTVVMADPLRTSSTIVYALEQGAREIIPVESVDFAVKVSGDAFGGQTLLAGERNDVKIEGFALGNSPQEFTEETVKGKSIILYTTNGSRALVKAKFAENLFVLSFNNLEAVAKLLLELNRDVEILCAGNNGLFSLEDSVCAGRLINKILLNSKGVEFTDSALAALELNKKFKGNLITFLKKTEKGKALISSGAGEDVEFIAKLSESLIVPAYDSGVIKNY